MKFVTVFALVMGLALSANANQKAKNRGATYETTAPAAPTYSYSSSAFTHEISTLSTVGGFFSGKQCKDCSTASVLKVSGSYLRYWQDNMQYGFYASFENLSKEASASGKSATRFDIVGQGAFNFSNDLANAIFAKAGVGLYSVLKDDGSDYENKIGLFLGAGKRFAWLKNVSYSPEVRLVKRGDIDFAIEADLLNFSIYW